MPFFDKHFSLQEANRLLPHIRTVFAKIHELLKQVKKPKISLHKEDPHKGSPQVKLNGDYSRIEENPQEMLDRINALISEITDQGIVIQDVQRGLIDFPAFVGGEEVFLCYELNDGDEIKFWHAIDAGYAGRTPIEE